MGNNGTVKYEEFMRKSVLYHFTESDPKKGLNQEISLEDFIQTVMRATQFVSVQPAEHILKACFE